jgi:hypothetical protein
LSRTALGVGSGKSSVTVSVWMGWSETKPTKVELSDWLIVTLSPVEVERVIGFSNWSRPTAVVPGGR